MLQPYNEMNYVPWYFGPCWQMWKEIRTYKNKRRRNAYEFVIRYLPSRLEQICVIPSRWPISTPTGLPSLDESCRLSQTFATVSSPPIYWEIWGVRLGPLPIRYQKRVAAMFHLPMLRCWYRLYELSTSTTEKGAMSAAREKNKVKRNKPS
jgi:hypothetical protein